MGGPRTPPPPPLACCHCTATWRWVPRVRAKIAAGTWEASVSRDVARSWRGWTVQQPEPAELVAAERLTGEPWRGRRPWPKLVQPPCLCDVGDEKVSKFGL
ncbi:hypothetical protein GCM10010344_70950 [Streptomyces bluensis]|nr:hypothetical protein GCM10010344_70950 [Streptomyces bluensis]